VAVSRDIAGALPPRNGLTWSMQSRTLTAAERLKASAVWPAAPPASTRPPATMCSTSWSLA